MKITRKQKKRVGVHKFRRIGRVFYRDDWKKQDMIRALCFKWNSFKYDEFKQYVAQVLHIRKDQRKLNLPIVIIGDAEFPPLPYEVDRYYLTYKKNHFIGEYEMRVYGENAFLIFNLHYPEDFDRYKEIAHRIVYLGSLCRIVFVASSDAALPQKTIKDEDLIDYDIIILKDTFQYLPNSKTLDSFEFMVPKKV